MLLVDLYIFGGFMKFDTYAPIAITTLNRFEHLKNVIEGLKLCPESIFSDLFISVDYPSEKKYELGYRKICEYLHNGIDGFNSVNIIYQQKNLGAMDNSAYIEKIIWDREYKYYIMLEDDMVPTPTFLSFMNKCFGLFYKDSSVIGIGGWETLIKDINGYNAVYTHFGACIGFFSDRRKMIIDKCANYNYLQEALKSKENRKKVLKYRKDSYWKFVVIALGLDDRLRKNDGSVAPVDYFSDSVCILEDLYTVFPIQSFINNTGLDGSGLHAGVVETDPPNFCLEGLDDIIVLDKPTSTKYEQNANDNREYNRNMLIRSKILVAIFLIFGRNAARKVNDYIEKIHIWKVNL